MLEAPGYAGTAAGELARGERLRHVRHLRGDPHFAFFQEELARRADAERAAALDESLPEAERLRHLHRYHLARELRDFLAAQEEVLTGAKRRGI